MNKKATVKDLSLQRRAFLLTCWPTQGNTWGSSNAIHEMTSLCESLKNMEFYLGQWEYSCENHNKHMQVLIRTKKKVRGRTIKKHFTNDFWKAPHVENVINIQNTKMYCMKSVCDKCGEASPMCARVEGTEPFSGGVWNAPNKGATKKASERVTCAQLITEGYSAEYIAYHHPKLFLTYGQKIISTIAHRKLYQQRQEFLTEEE